MTSSSNPASVAVVGAGFAGLSAACHLRNRGHAVTVIDAADGPGGWARSVQHGPFRFDGGPTVITMPDLLADTFAAVGADMANYCTLQRLDPFYTANFADGSRIRIRSTLADTRAELIDVAGPDAGPEFDGFIRWLDELNDLEFDTFINRDVRSVPAMASNWRELAGLAKHGGFRTWQSTAAEFFSDERLRRLFSFQSMYAGVSPLDALGLFAVIAHMDSVQGVFVPVGGVGALAQGLCDAAAAAGVEFRFGERVRSITPYSDGPVLTVDDQTEIKCDVAVVTADLPVAKRELLGLSPRWSARRATPSPSCLVWHLAAHGDVPSHTSHHNIHFGRQWDAAFRQLFDEGRPMEDPSRFVTVGSISDPTAAPEGAHALYVLEPVPNLSADLDWETLTPELTERMLQWAAPAGYPVESAELVTTIDPPAWRHRGGTAGTPFSLAHHFFQSGPFRPDHEDTRAPGVVFAGAGTRPGVGIPMVLISGRLAAQRTCELVNDRRGTRL